MRTLVPISLPKAQTFRHSEITRTTTQDTVVEQRPSLVSQFPFLYGARSSQFGIVVEVASVQHGLRSFVHAHNTVRANTSLQRNSLSRFGSEAVDSSDTLTVSCARRTGCG